MPRTPSNAAIAMLVMLESPLTGYNYPWEAQNRELDEVVCKSRRSQRGEKAWERTA